MVKKNLIFFIGFSIVGILYFDPFHKLVETIDILIGKNLDFANKLYFKSEVDETVTFNINSKLNEFQGGVLSKKSLITDSIIHQYTWNYFNYKKTIWVAKTQKQKFQIIDAIRYKNNVNF